MLKSKKWLLLALLLIFTANMSVAETVKREMRSVWIATVANIDWPKTKGTSASIVQSQKADLIEYANYDLIFSKTKQGANRNDCFKLTFGKCEAVKAFQSIQDKLWIRTFLIYPYMFFEISPVKSEHARTLSFQAGSSSDGKTTNRGTLVQKIVCETAAEKAMIEKFIGKYGNGRARPA